MARCSIFFSRQPFDPARLCEIQTHKFKTQVLQSNWKCQFAPLFLHYVYREMLYHFISESLTQIRFSAFSMLGLYQVFLLVLKDFQSQVGSPNPITVNLKCYIHLRWSSLKNYFWKACLSNYLASICEGKQLVEDDFHNKTCCVILFRCPHRVNGWPAIMEGS